MNDVVVPHLHTNSEQKSATGARLNDTKNSFATNLNTIVKLSTTKRPIKNCFNLGHKMSVIMKGNDPKSPKLKKTRWNITSRRKEAPMKHHNCPKISTNCVTNKGAIGASANQ